MVQSAILCVWLHCCGYRGQDVITNPEAVTELGSFGGTKFKKKKSSSCTIFPVQGHTGELLSAISPSAFLQLSTSVGKFGPVTSLFDIILSHHHPDPSWATFRLGKLPGNASQGLSPLCFQNKLQKVQIQAVYSHSLQIRRKHSSQEPQVSVVASNPSCVSSSG